MYELKWSWGDVKAEGPAYEGFEPFAVTAVRTSSGDGSERERVWWRRRLPDPVKEVSVAVSYERDPVSEKVGRHYKRTLETETDRYLRSIPAGPRLQAHEAINRAEELERKVHPTLSAGSGLTRDEFLWALRELQYHARGWLLLHDSYEAQLSGVRELQEERTKRANLEIHQANQAIASLVKERDKLSTELVLLGREIPASKAAVDRATIEVLANRAEMVRLNQALAEALTERDQARRELEDLRAGPLFPEHRDRDPGPTSEG